MAAALRRPRRVASLRDCEATGSSFRVGGARSETRTPRPGHWAGALGPRAAQCRRVAGRLRLPAGPALIRNIT